MPYVSILFPICMGAVALLIPSQRWRPWVLPVTGTGNLILVLVLFQNASRIKGGGWIAIDSLGLLLQLVVGTLFFFCSYYAVGYLAQRPDRQNRIFCACLAAFTGLANLVGWSHHMGLLWVGIEAITLILTPTIYFNHNRLSLEATWKYFLIGSVGVALALLGTFFLGYSSLHGGFDSSLIFEHLMQHAPDLSKPWLHVAFMFLFVGYGTKMGLAPMHTWKPDVYGETPGVVGALFAGGVTSCAFLAMMRMVQIAAAAGESEFMSGILIPMGLFSMAVAGLFMVGQRDFKRLLAYSSVEHMGILILGVGIGGPARFGALFHMGANALTKGVLFLSAGNIHRAFGSKRIGEVHGAMRVLPLSGALFLTGFFAITGSPPFAPFISEFTILRGAFSTENFLAGGLFLILLLLVFMGMGTTVLQVVQGEPPEALAEKNVQESFLTIAPIFGLLALVLVFGVFLPEPLAILLRDASASLGGKP